MAYKQFDIRKPIKLNEDLKLELDKIKANISVESGIKKSMNDVITLLIKNYEEKEKI